MISSSIIPVNQCINLAKKNFQENDLLKTCIPPITLLACSAIFVPNAMVGIGCGTAATTLKLLVLRKQIKFPLVKTVFIKDGMDTKKYNIVLSISKTIFGPILEELIFGGMLQPLLSYTIIKLVPSSETTLFAPSLSIAISISILVNAIIFGKVHDSLTTQKVISGVAYGAVAAIYGLPLSFIAHMTHNTIFHILENLFGEGVQEVKL